MRCVKSEKYWHREKLKFRYKSTNSAGRMHYPLLFLDSGHDWHYKSFIFDQPDETSLLLITHSYYENSADPEYSS